MNPTATLSRSRALAALTPSDRLFWGVLAAIAASVPPWADMASVHLTGLPQALMVVLALMMVRATYILCRPGAGRVHDLLENGAGIIAYTAVLAPVSYLCARNSMPLWDDAFRAADRLIGYDWHAWADAEGSIPALDTVLRLAYASLLPQTVVMLALLPIVGDGKRGFSLIRASLIAVIFACAGSYALPAAMPEGVDTDWYPHWAALRGPAPFTAALAQAQGIITFPSFHASLAVLLFHASRGLGPVTWAFGVLELLMLISTTTYGHHYLCDVIAGIVVALIAIALTAQLDRLFPTARLSPCVV